MLLYISRPVRGVSLLGIRSFVGQGSTLAAADGAGSSRAHRDGRVDLIKAVSTGIATGHVGLVAAVDDSPVASHHVVARVGARSPGTLGRAAEVVAVVPHFATGAVHENLAPAVIRAGPAGAINALVQVGEVRISAQVELTGFGNGHGGPDGPLLRVGVVEGGEVRNVAEL